MGLLWMLRLGHCKQTYMSSDLHILHVSEASPSAHSIAAKTHGCKRPKCVSRYCSSLQTNASFYNLIRMEKDWKWRFESADSAHVRRHVGLFWSRDALGTEVRKRHMLFQISTARGKQRVSLNALFIIGVKSFT